MAETVVENVRAQLRAAIARMDQDLGSIKGAIEDMTAEKYATERRCKLLAEVVEWPDSLLLPLIADIQGVTLASPPPPRPEGLPF